MDAFSIGDVVLIPSKNIAGIIQYIGTTDFAAGTWVGIELPSPDGMNDGEVKGRRYFTCPQGHGMFARPGKIKRLDSNDTIPVKASNSNAKVPPPAPNADRVEDDDEPWILDVDVTRGIVSAPTHIEEPISASITSTQLSSKVSEASTTQSASPAPTKSKPKRPSSSPNKVKAEKPSRPSAAPDRSKKPLSEVQTPADVVIEATAKPRLVRTQTDGPLKPGDKLEGDDLEIELLKQIGEGSFATVFEAIETTSKLVIAAKIFIEGDDNTTTHSARMALAKHEYNVVGFLNHDNIVRVHGLLMTNGTVCILQELLPNGDLFNAVQPGYGLEAELAVNCISGLCSALRYLHDPIIDLVHLDLKPENILLSGNNEPKLCDFDTAMKIGSTPMTMRGTPEYQAPESMPSSAEYWILRESTSSGGYPIHPALDVWAAGLVAYLLMFGDYCWGKADRANDDQYYRFYEGEHMSVEPWNTMPQQFITFFNRTLDARQDFRATASELVDIVTPDWKDKLEKMRDDQVTKTKQKKAVKLALNELNQTDNWLVNLVPKQHGKVIKYEITCTPPREVNKESRIVVEVRYRRLLQFHNIATVRHPPLSVSNPNAIRPVAIFPKKKRFGNKSSKFVDQRRNQLLEYFKVTFLSSELAIFWYDAFRELKLLDDAGEGDDDDGEDY